MITSVVAKFKNKNIEYKPKEVAPALGQYARIKDWTEWTTNGQNVFDFNSHGQNITFMATVKQIPVLANWLPVKITDEIAEWWLDIQRSVMPAGTPIELVMKTLAHACGGNIAFCNNTGLGWDYGNRHNPWATSADEVGGKDLIGLGYTLSVGSTVKIKRRTTIPGKEKNVYAIEAFDYSKSSSYLGTTYAQNPHKFWIATTASRNPYKLNPFPQTKGLSVDRRPIYFTRTVIPIFAPDQDEVYVPDYWIKILPEGTTPPVYPYGVP